MDFVHHHLHWLTIFLWLLFRLYARTQLQKQVGINFPLHTHVTLVQSIKIIATRSLNQHIGKQNMEIRCNEVKYQVECHFKVAASNMFLLKRVLNSFIENSNHVYRVFGQ